MELPDFNLDGLLPPGGYEMTLDNLKASMLVVGPGERCPNWDSGRRLRLVENLETMVGQLWEVGVAGIFVDGSFVEDRDHPGDIDGYFECEVLDIATGRLQRELNEFDPHKVWTWDPGSRRPYKNQPKRQLPMWHRYRVELYPHYVDVALGSQGSGIRDECRQQSTVPGRLQEVAKGTQAEGNRKGGGALV